MKKCPAAAEEFSFELTRLFKHSRWLRIVGGSAFYAGVIKDSVGREISGVAVRSDVIPPGFNFLHAGFAFFLSDAETGAPLSRSFCRSLLK